MTTQAKGTPMSLFHFKWDTIIASVLQLKKDIKADVGSFEYIEDRLLS